MIAGVRRVWRRGLESWRQWHVDARCSRAGCDCPCGRCKHDRRHVPGGNGSGTGLR